jgi:hypothetical protein
MGAYLARSVEQESTSTSSRESVTELGVKAAREARSMVRAAALAEQGSDAAFARVRGGSELAIGKGESLL